MRFLKTVLTLVLPVTLLVQQTHAETEPQTLRIAVVANAVSGKVSFVGSPQIVANDEILKSELAKRHVALQWVPITPTSVATLVNEAFTNKQIDFAFYGDLPSVILNSSGTSTRLVAPGSVGNNVYLVVPPNSNVRSITDLKGKRIALHRGRPWEVSFGKLLATNNLTFNDIKVINLNPQAGAAALAAGSVDAFFTMSDAYTLADKGVGKIIWSSQNLSDDWKMRAELWGATDFIQKYPEITQLLVDANVRAAYWISQDKNKDTFIREQTKFGQPESVIQREYQNKYGSWQQNWSPLFTPTLTQHYQQVASYALSAKLIRKPVDSNQLLEPKFIPIALKNLKLDKYWTTGNGAGSSSTARAKP